MSDMSPNPAAQQPPVGPADSSLPVPAPPAYPVVQQTEIVEVSVVPAKRGMYTAAAVINWVTLGIVIVGTLGFGVIAAAWFIPMTIQIHKGAKGPYKHTALGVCTLLFCNFISGILMLVDDSNRPAKPVA
jgi:hypothetical protein